MKKEIVAQDHVEDWEKDEKLMRFLTEDEVPDEVKYHLRDDEAIKRWIKENPVCISLNKKEKQ